MFFKTNKCTFIGVRTKAFTMQSKNKIGAWAHMRPPLCKNLMHQSLVTTAPTPGAGDNRGNERGFDLQIIPGRAREQPGVCPIYAKTAVQ